MFALAFENIQPRRIVGQIGDGAETGPRSSERSRPGWHPHKHGLDMPWAAPAILILGCGECAKQAEALSSGLVKQLQGARLRSCSRGWPAEKGRVGQSGAVTG
jgi:hypothetical protein